ncbi:MAG: hypothetical protein RJA57_129 [Bacteroidota bacterium]|jgi:hypothetical protein
MQELGFYFRLGWEHIISPDALDHQLFIIALVALYMARDWKQLLILITAFTIGHSLTLALSVFDIVRFDRNWVEFLIPCTIVIAALYNVFHQKPSPNSIRVTYAIALVFGLVHGMGFANTIRFMLASDQSIGWGLLGFNLGLEVGQIAMVIGLLILAQVLVGLFRINRRDWILFLSAGVFSLALKMALDRIP